MCMFRAVHSPFNTPVIQQSVQQLHRNNIQPKFANLHRASYMLRPSRGHPQGGLQQRSTVVGDHCIPFLETPTPEDGHLEAKVCRGYIVKWQMIVKYCVLCSCWIECCIMFVVCLLACLLVCVLIYDLLVPPLYLWVLWLLANNELEGTWKAAGLAYFEVICQQLLGRSLIPGLRAEIATRDLLNMKQHLDVWWTDVLYILHLPACRQCTLMSLQTVTCRLYR